MVEKKRNIQFKPRPDAMNVYKVQNNKWVDTRSLNEQRTYAKNVIDIVAEDVRKKYISSFPGQIGVYNEKYLNAKAYIDAGYPEIDESSFEYIFVYAEAAAMNSTHKEAADLIVKTRNIWIRQAAQIERVRRHGKISVDNAVSEVNINKMKQKTLDALNLI